MANRWRWTVPRRPSIRPSTCCWPNWLARTEATSLSNPFQKERSTSMDFRPLNDTERRQLVLALRGNAESDRAILMDRRDTSFAGTADEVTDEEVISAIKSVPCHY